LSEPFRLYIRQYMSKTSKYTNCKVSREVGIANCHGQNSEEACWKKYMSFCETYNSVSKEIMIHDMRVVEDFLNEEEEKSLLEEVEPYMRRLKYEFDHWDDVS